MAASPPSAARAQRAGERVHALVLGSDLEAGAEGSALRDRAVVSGKPGPVRCHSTWPRPSARRAALDVVPLVQHPLQPGHRLGRVGGDRGGQLQRGVLGRRRGRDPVDQAQAEGLVGADRARGEQQVLGGGEAAEGDQASRADRHAEGGAGEAHPQVGAADPHVAGDGDLGATADDVAVAGGDRRLREGDDPVVEVGEELHPARSCPPRRAPRGRRRRRRGPGGRWRR